MVNRANCDKKYFDSLLSQGISHFVYNHLQEQLEVNLENLSTKENFDSWLKTKEIIVSQMSLSSIM